MNGAEQRELEARLRPLCGARGAQEVLQLLSELGWHSRPLRDAPEAVSGDPEGQPLSEFGQAALVGRLRKHIDRLIEERDAALEALADCQREKEGHMTIRYRPIARAVATIAGRNRGTQVGAESKPSLHGRREHALPLEEIEALLAALVYFAPSYEATTQPFMRAHARACVLLAEFSVLTPDQIRDWVETWPVPR